MVKQAYRHKVISNIHDWKGPIMQKLNFICLAFFIPLHLASWSLAMQWQFKLQYTGILRYVCPSAYVMIYQLIYRKFREKKSRQMFYIFKIIMFLYSKHTCILFPLLYFWYRDVSVEAKSPSMKMFVHRREMISGLAQKKPSQSQQKSTRLKTGTKVDCVSFNKTNHFYKSTVYSCFS